MTWGLYGFMLDCLLGLVFWRETGRKGSRSPEKQVLGWDEKQVLG